MLKKVDLKRFEDSVVALEQQPVLKGKCLLYGDSLFTRWKREVWGNEDAETVLRREKDTQSVVNHGFGGSTAEELLYYYCRLVRPYEPKTLVLSVFGNDWLFGYSASEIFFLVSRIMDWARADFEGIRLYICTANASITENSKKTNLIQIRSEYNMLIRMYADAHKDCQIIDLVGNPLFFADPSDCGQYDKVRQDLFIEDCVHYNQLGYKLFGEYMKGCLSHVL